MGKEMVDFTILIKQDEDGIFVANVPEVQGCYTQGKTLQEVMERIKEAIEVCLEADEQNLGPQLRPEFIKEMKEIEKGKHYGFKDINELRKLTGE